MSEEFDEVAIGLKITFWIFWTVVFVYFLFTAMMFFFIVANVFHNYKSIANLLFLVAPFQLFILIYSINIFLNKQKKLSNSTAYGKSLWVLLGFTLINTFVFYMGCSRGL